MSAIVYRICTLLEQVLKGVPLGTNLGLLHLLFALLSGRFLPSRGAVFPALADSGLPNQAVRRAQAALRAGRFSVNNLVSNWHGFVQQEGHFHPHHYEGIRPVACDLTAFFRPQLKGLTSKHYAAEVGKALPAVVFGLCVRVGSVGKQRFGLPCLLLRGEARESDTTLQKRLVHEAATCLKDDEALIVDAGFDLATLQATGKNFVVRLKKNAMFRRNTLPVYKGQGRPPEYGEVVRPLARVRKMHPIAATPPDSHSCWDDKGYALHAYCWEEVVLPKEKAGGTGFRVVAIVDPRYREPLLLATNLRVSCEALWRLYRDRWAVEQVPLSGKPMLGCERSFVFGDESRYRLPALALLCGNILSYLGATSPVVSTGFWDRAARPTCGRLRRVLGQVRFSELPVASGQFRKKASVTAHLETGVRAHRRTKAGVNLRGPTKTGRFTGN